MQPNLSQENILTMKFYVFDNLVVKKLSLDKNGAMVIPIFLENIAPSFSLELWNFLFQHPEIVSIRVQIIIFFLCDIIK